MNLDIVWHFKTSTDNSWAAYLWISCLVFLAIAKFLSENRFFEYLRIFYNDKFIKSNRDNKTLVNWFLVVLYLNNSIVLTFLILILADFLEIANRFDHVNFLRIFVIIATFSLSKTLIEKIVANSFDIESYYNQLKFHKSTFQNYTGILLLPFTAMLYYSEILNSFFVIILMIYALILVLFFYTKTIRIHQSWLMSRMFYFILYLCTLEIMPFILIYYWLEKN